MRNLSLHATLFLSLLLSPPLQAKTVPDNFPVLLEDAPDNSDAYVLFHRAGLTPVPENARPVSRISESQGSHFSYGHYSLNYQGWVWENDEGETVLLRGNRIVERPVQILSQQGGGIHRTPMQENTLIAHQANLLQDLRRHFEQVNQMREHRHHMTQSDPGEIGRHMILAVRLHETGYTSLANQLSAHLFETHGKRETLLSAISTLHDDQYEHLFRQYLDHQDLSRLIEEVETHIDDNGRAWLNRDIAEEQIDAWKAALEADPQPLDDFSEAQNTLRRHILDITPEALSHLRWSLQQDWLLAPKPVLLQRIHAMQGHMPDSEDTDESLPAVKLISALKSTGNDALPVLLSLLDESHILPMDARHSQGYSGGRTFTSSEDHRRYQRLQRFPRPTIIGDLVRSWIQAVLPDKRNLRTDDDFILAAETFLDDIQGKSRFEIAKLHLEASPSLNHLSDEAFLTLVALGEEQTLTQLRETILGDPNILQLSDKVIHTPLSEGEQGEAFLTAYADTIRDLHAADLQEEDNWRGQQARRVLHQLDAAPEAHEDAPTLQKFVDKILAGEVKQVGRHMGALQMLNTDAEDIQQVLLPAILHADEADEPILWQLYHTLLMSLQTDFSRMYGMHQPYTDDTLAYYRDPDHTPGTSEPQEPPVLPEKESLHPPLPELWSPLLNRAQSPEERRRDNIAASMLIYLLDFEFMHTFSHVLQTNVPGDDEALHQTLNDIAQQILEDPRGDWDEHLPHPERVDEERAKEMSTILHGDDPEAIHTLLHTSDLSEILLLTEMLHQSNARDNAALLEAVQPHRRKLVYLHFPSDQAPTELQPGETLTPGHVTTLLRHAQQRARNGNAGNIVLHERPVTPGIFFFHTSQVMGLDGGSSQKGQVTLFVHGPTSGHMTFDLDEDIQLTNRQPTPSESTDLMSMLGGDWATQSSENVIAWVEGDDIPYGQGGLYISYMPAPEAPEEDEESTE